MGRPATVSGNGTDGSVSTVKRSQRGLWYRGKQRLSWTGARNSGQNFSSGYALCRRIIPSDGFIHREENPYGMAMGMRQSHYSRLWQTSTLSYSHSTYGFKMLH
ncbi:unnamed protein product [Clonostachys rosea]|uniref:Uncharacterized protein n=1 Tax=Bionectria ochroleuca TaxID=29856 RepID=A0ABY6UX26_BIOOC|nr:unnamed protein product [Clonostachys rosea]